MRILARAAIASVALLVLIAVALVLTAQFWMVRWLDGALAQPGVEGHHGAVRYSLLRGHLEIDDLVVESELPVPRTYRAAHVEADGIGGRFLLDLAWQEPVLHLPAITARDVAANAEGLSARCADLEVQDVAYDQGQPQAEPPIFFRRLQLRALTFEDANAGAMLADGTLTMTGSIGAPSAASMKLDGLVITPKALRAASLGRMTLAFVGEVSLDVAEKRLAVSHHLLWREGGALDLSLRLGGVSPSLVGESGPALATALAGASLDGLELRYTDASGLNRMLSFVATLRGEDAETLRAELINWLEARRPLVAKKPAVATSLTALEKFLREGGGLSVTAAPVLRVPFAGLALVGARDPARVAELLGLSIRSGTGASY